MMGPTTAAVMAALLTHGAPVPVTRPALTVSRAVSAITRADDRAIRGRVHALELAPSPSGTAIVIGVNAAVTLQHFTLENPSRIVVDLGGADLAIRSNYDGKARGAVRNIRLSQYRADTVRRVIDLDAAHKYPVERDGDAIRLMLEGPAATFARWGSRPRAGSTVTAVADGRLDAPAASGPAARVVEAAAVVPPTDAPTAAPSAPLIAPPTVVTTALPEVAVHVVAIAPAKMESPTLDAVKPEPVQPEPVKPEPARAEPAGAEPAFDPITPRTPATAASVAAVRRQPQKPRITVSYDGTSIRDVIAAFATFSGRTIVIGKDVDGQVTADIADKPWDVALQAILQSQGLAATEDASGIIKVDSYQRLAANQALEPLVTQIIDINYSKATVLRNTVQALLVRDCTGLNTMASGRSMGMPIGQGGGGGGQQQMGGEGCVVRGSVAADSATNKLIISEVPSRLPDIVSRIQQLDVRTPQVAIKAMIIFVNRTGIQDIGLAYDLGTGNKQFFQQLVPRIDPSTLTAVDTDGDGVPDATGGGSAFQGPARIALGGNAIAGIANANNAIKPNALNLIY
ncbi:MAG: AMIN domain-containing protein, partial [Gemmatimonadaceae bacterium]